MGEVLKALGLIGAIGALIGVALVSLIKPTTSGGVFILIVVPALLGAGVGGVFGALNKRKDKTDEIAITPDDEEDRSP